MSAGYKIIDEIDPVSDEAWALHPDLTFWATMFLPTLWLGIVGAMNSFLLGHPRRKHHAALCAAAVIVVKAIVFVAGTYFPEVTWKYWSLPVSAIRLWLAYYLTEEQTWAAQMFQHAGGKVASLRTTIAVVNVLSRLIPPWLTRRMLRPVR